MGWLPHRVSALGRRVRGRPLGVSATRRQAAGERMELKKQGREHGEREHQMPGQDLAGGAVRKGSRARLPARRGDQGGRALGVQAARGEVATARVDARRESGLIQPPTSRGKGRLTVASVELGPHALNRSRSLPPRPSSTSDSSPRSRGPGYGSPMSVSPLPARMTCAPIWPRATMQRMPWKRDFPTIRA